MPLLVNLEFEEVNWSKNPELLYVAFRNQGQVIKWYPRWDDLRSLIQAAIISEGLPNNWQSPELNKFKTTFGEMTELINVSRSFHEARYCPR